MVEKQLVKTLLSRTKSTDLHASNLGQGPLRCTLRTWEKLFMLENPQVSLTASSSECSSGSNTCSVVRHWSVSTGNIWLELLPFIEPKGHSCYYTEALDVKWLWCADFDKKLNLLKRPYYSLKVSYLKITLREKHLNTQVYIPYSSVLR